VARGQGRAGWLTRGLVLATACGALALAGCGGDDEGKDDGGGEAKPLAVELKQAGPAEFTITAPTSAQAGAVRIDFRNGSKVPAETQLIKVDGDQPADQVIKEIFDAGEGAPTPPWAHAAGGVGGTAPGASGTATQVLEPGTYHLFGLPDTEDENVKPAVTTIKVEGEGGGELPDAPATITAEDYGFVTDGLKAGKNTIRFENAGKEPHHVIAAPFAPGATIEDVKAFAMTEGEPEGPPPVDLENTRNTVVLDGGVDQVTEIELQKGKYALVCFISDRAGGPPHVAKGMLAEVDVP